MMAQDAPPSSNIIRPRAVKAVQNPMLTERFQQECRETGVPSSAAAHAVMQAAEWNRRWVQQEEEGHTMPHDTNTWADELRNGAKNPSLSGDERSEGESSPAVTPELPMQCSSPVIAPVATVAAAPTATMTIIRPLALRPCDPSPQFYADMESPQSPLTLPSESNGPIMFDDLSFESLSNTQQYMPQQEQWAYDNNNEYDANIPSIILPPRPRRCIENAKETLLHSLAIAGGDVETKAFEDALLPLIHHYEETGWDARDPEGIYSNYANTRRVEGMWLTLSKPTYFGNLGQTAEGDPMYTLGRMAFDMFLPTQLVCSLQGNFNPVDIVSPDERAELLAQCPKSLMDEIENGSSVLRRYNIVTAFTIEPHLADFPKAPNRDVRRPIKGIMTTCGYVLPDPTVPNRLSIWFTGGRIEPNDDENDEREWKRLFNRDLPQRNLGEKVRLLAAQLLMGAEAPTTMNPDGTMSFEFTRPLGGHGVAYVDVIYLDDTLRIVRGHRGTIFAFVRIPENA